MGVSTDDAAEEPPAPSPLPAAQHQVGCQPPNHMMPQLTPSPQAAEPSPARAGDGSLTVCNLLPWCLLPRGIIQINHNCYYKVL